MEGVVIRRGAVMLKQVSTMRFSWADASLDERGTGHGAEDPGMH